MMSTKKVLFLAFLSLFQVGFTHALNGYNHSSWYWTIGACIDFVFWATTLWGRKSRLKPKEILLYSVLSIRFCFYFLPTEAILSLSGRAFDYLTMFFAIAVILFGKDDDNTPKKRGRSLKQKKRWKPFLDRAIA